MFRSNHTMQFGLIDYHESEDLKETLVGKDAPKIVLIKNGLVYVSPVFKESYH